MANGKIELSHVGKVIKQIWNNSGDILICISGDEGSSKSTLAYWIATMVQKDFDIEEQMAYTGRLGIKLMLTLPKNTVCWMDENLFYKRDHAKKENKAANTILQRVRYKKRLYILCSPRLGDLDEYIRNHRIKLWFRVIERGEAELLIPIKKEIGDPWNLEEPRKMGMKNKQGFILYDKMPEEVELKYEQIKDNGFVELKEHYDKELTL
jgi:hypothetical protein